MPDKHPPGYEYALKFPLVEALLGRRARRFAVGTSIPDGVLAYESKHKPMPLSDLEQMMILTAAGGNTAWLYLIARNERYAPYLSNYSGTAGGRTFPSAAGFHTSEIFFTDDTGIYFMETRDAPAMGERAEDGTLELDELIEAHKSRIRKVSDKRLYIPPEVPYMEGHNTWISNRAGTMLVIPVGDLAQHVLLGLCYYLQGGFAVYDDIHNKTIPGIEKYEHLYDKESLLPISFVEMLSLGELTVELATACYAGMLMLQAMGLGGWMYDGLDPYTVLGASGNPDVPGLGFRYDTNEKWPLPNPTGLPGVFEGHCPPHYPDMRAAVEAVAKRKFGAGGPYNPETPGPYKDTAKVRGAAQVHSEEFKDCVGLMAQYIYDTFGRFPGTVPSIYCLMHLQAQHIDLDFYDRFFEPGAYLETHKKHMEMWHP